MAQEENKPGKDIRMPENDLSREEQVEKSTRNADDQYEAESPIDPYQEDYEEITDRAQDNIDAAENDMEQEDEFGDPDTRADEAISTDDDISIDDDLSDDE